MMMSRAKLICGFGYLMAAVVGCAKDDPTRPNYMAGAVKGKHTAPSLPADPPKILPKTHFAAGRLFETQGQIGQAIEQYRRAVAVNHGYAEAYHRLGRMHYLAGQHDEALGALARAVELSPKNAAYHNDLSFELMHQKRWAEAERHLRQAIELEPKFARAHINLGLALSRQEQYEEALASFREVLPEADAQYNLGLMYRGQKRYAAAAEAFRRVLEINADFSAARVQLEQLAAQGSVPLGTDERMAYYTDEEFIEPAATTPETPPTIFQLTPAKISQEPKSASVRVNDAILIAPDPQEGSVAGVRGTAALAPPTVAQAEGTGTSGFTSEAARVEDALKSKTSVPAGLSDGGHAVQVMAGPAAEEPVADDEEEAGQPQPTGTGSEPAVAVVAESEPLTEWEGLSLTFRQLREVLENDANCELEQHEAAAAADQPVRRESAIAAGPGVRADFEPAAPTELVEFAQVSNSKRSVGGLGLRLGTDAVGPVFLESSKSLATMGPPSSPTDVPGFRTVVDRIVPVQEPSSIDWRTDFSGLSALAARSENDFRCWRDSAVQQRGRVVFSPWMVPIPSQPQRSEKPEDGAGASATLGTPVSNGRFDAPQN